MGVNLEHLSTSLLSWTLSLPYLEHHLCALSQCSQSRDRKLRFSDQNELDGSRLWLQVRGPAEGFAWFSPASSDNCRVMTPALWRASPFTFLDASGKFHKASVCPSVRKENLAVTGRMLLKSSKLFLFSRKSAEKIKFGGNRKKITGTLHGEHMLFMWLVFIM